MKRLIFLSCLVLFLVPAAVQAHVYMLECFPPKNAIMFEAPDRVTMTFVGSVEPMFSKIEVFDSSGKKVSKKTFCKEDDTVMEAPLEENLPPGEYKTKWKVMSLDGHKQKGEFTFKIQPK